MQTYNLLRLLLISLLAHGQIAAQIYSPFDYSLSSVKVESKKSYVLSQAPKASTIFKDQGSEELNVDRNRSVKVLLTFIITIAAYLIIFSSSQPLSTSQPVPPKPEDLKLEGPKLEDSKSEGPKSAQSLSTSQPVPPQPEGPKPAQTRLEGPKSAQSLSTSQTEEPKLEDSKSEGPKSVPPQQEGPKLEGPKTEEPKPDQSQQEGPKLEDSKLEGPKPAQTQPEDPKLEKVKQHDNFFSNLQQAYTDLIQKFREDVVTKMWARLFSVTNAQAIKSPYPNSAQRQDTPEKHDHSDTDSRNQ